LSNEHIERRLTAILAADVAGYSRLVEADEEGSLVQWKAHWETVIEPAIKEHRGRIARVIGDSILAEFGSVVDAVRCAVEVQRGMAKRNVDVPPDQRIEFRIGVNFGELIIEAGDFWGDGINIAARLEALADPGGVCISGRVQEDTQGKVEIAFEDMGVHHLKNIARPVRVYRVRFDGVTKSTPALVLPSKPSIVVLPFQNMSGNVSEDYFADGIVEEITTALSHFRWLFVIARNSSFTYKGRIVDVKQVGRDLGVRYALEGSVRKAADRVRVSAQLVDAITGHHVWAQRYDRELAGIFMVQDEITERVVAAVEPQLYAAEGIRARRKPPESMDAWECVVRALGCINSRSQNDYAMALEFLERAIELDRSYAQAYALFAYVMGLEVLYGWKSREITLTHALEAAQKAVVLDGDDAWAHFALGFLYGMMHRAEEAIVEHETALDLNPNFALAYTYLAVVLAYLGRSEEALLKVDLSERLSPRGLFQGVNAVCRALAHFSAGQYRDALSWARKSILDSPGIVTGYRILVVSCALAGELDEARSALEIVKRLQPDLSLRWIEESILFTREKARQDIIEGFRLAGLE
jgi:TolB-like protein/tetratricopeptide (TPR) repeat protein